MIVAGTDKYIWIDLGKDEPSVVLQCLERGIVCAWLFKDDPALPSDRFATVTPQFLS